MSNLKNLVPPLDLCKLIPAGEFEDTAIMWKFDNIHAPFIELKPPHYNAHQDYWLGKNHVQKYPAPTLHEIMAELSLCDVHCDTGWFCMVGSPDHWSIGNCECDLYVRNGTENNSPEAAALKVWLKLKGIEDGE